MSLEQLARPEAGQRWSGLVDDEPSWLVDEMFALLPWARLDGWHLAHPLMQVPEENPSFLRAPSMPRLLDLPLRLEEGLLLGPSRLRSPKGMARPKPSSEFEREACNPASYLGMELRCTGGAKYTSRLDDRDPFSSALLQVGTLLIELLSIAPMTSQQQ